MIADTLAQPLLEITAIAGQFSGQLIREYLHQWRWCPAQLGSDGVIQEKRGNVAGVVRLFQRLGQERMADMFGPGGEIKGDQVGQRYRDVIVSVKRA